MKCDKCTGKEDTIRTHGCPFICSACGTNYLEAQAIMDVVFIWPVPKPKKITRSSLIELPDIVDKPEDELNGRSPFGVVVSKGAGFFYDSGEFLSLAGLSVGDMVIYDSLLPNVSWYDGMDGKQHPIIRCGYLDLGTVVELDEDEAVDNIKSVTG